MPEHEWDSYCFICSRTFVGCRLDKCRNCGSTAIEHRRVDQYRLMERNSDESVLPDVAHAR